MDTQLSVEASVGIGLGIGTLCGLVTMLVRSVGLFMVGLLLGLLVGVASLVVRNTFGCALFRFMVIYIQNPKKITFNMVLKMNDERMHVTKKEIC